MAQNIQHRRNRRRLIRGEVRHFEQLRKITRDGDILRYHGNSDEVGCFVAGIPLSKRTHYYEVTIIKTGVRGMIAVGLVPKMYSLDQQPGWLPKSVAFHADDGKLYNGSTVGQQFGPKCCRGDRIGCGISLDSEDGQLKVFFTKNGEEIGSVEVLPSLEPLYPAVGMHSLGEEVRLDMNAEWRMEEDDGLMIVDSHEEDWSRLHDVKVTGTLLQYKGKGRSIRDVGLAQARHPLNTRFHYCELEITDEGEKCYIALGLARRDYPKDRQPGWNRGSIAYHADDGKLFLGSGVGEQFGPRCFEGDVMGCGIIFPRDYSLAAEDDVDDWDFEEVPQPNKVQNDLYSNNEDEEDENDGQDMEGKKVTPAIGHYIYLSMLMETGRGDPDLCLPSLTNMLGDGKRITDATDTLSIMKIYTANVFFTRNGQVVGRREVALPDRGLYPTIGMMSVGEKVKVDLHPLSG